MIRAARVLSALLLLAPAAASGQDALQDYPQWRGRNRDGGASAFHEPTSWPDTLTRKWRTDVGEGYATPILVGVTVYGFTRLGDREGLTALDAATGEVRWRSDYAAPYSPGRPAAVHGAGPKATPLFYQGKLFTLGISGIVSAFDAGSGRLLWQTPPPSEPPFFSAASSPMAADGLVIVHPGNYGPLTAFDADDGAVRWVAGESGFFMSPNVADLDGLRQAVSITQKAIIGVSIADGRLLWQYPWPGGGAGGTMPIVHDGTIIASASGMGVIALRPTRRGENWSVALVWETKDVSMYLSNPVIVGDALFGLSQRGSGQFFAIDVSTGQTLWLGPPRQAANSAVAKAANLLFFLNDNGELIVARSDRSAFAPLARYTVAETATWAQPAISGNRLFIKDQSTLALWAID